MNISLNININNSQKVVQFNYLLLGILVLSCILRFYNLGFQGAWIDELYTLKQADPDLSFQKFNEMNMFYDGIPHLYFLIVKFFGIIFGHTIYTIRLVSVIFGVLGVFGMYLLGKEIAGKNVGYIAALLLAVHPFHIEYSQEGRSYAMLAFFVIMAYYRLVIFLKNVNLKNAIYLGLFTGLITNAQPIGIISVISIFLVVGIMLLFMKAKKERIDAFKYGFAAGIVTLLVFLPVYQKVVNASKITSFWVLKPTYDYVKMVMSQVTGGSILFVYLSVAALAVILIMAFVKKSTSQKLSEKPFFSAVIVLVWVLFYFLFIFIKSLGESSLFLHRYFIPMVPGLALAIALAVSYIKSNAVKAVCATLVSCVFLYNMIIERSYYTTRVKSQFNDICLQIKEENKQNETIISSWGWLLSFYLDKDFKINNVYEKTLDAYINDVKTNSVVQESFWYIDGNSKPYSVSAETQEFLDKNYQVEKTIELHDCWAKHFISKKAADNKVKAIRLNQFQNAKFDGSGNLAFFENSKSASLPVYLTTGNYQLTIAGISLPGTKIKNENAKVNIYLNSKLSRTIELDEKETKEFTIDFIQQKDENLTVEIEFINDFWLDGLDRNALISNIKLKKVDF
ncbi:glycosyltransferase family 39 protein [Flavobacterium macrobrachii]|uniref:Glycosyltransferase family 39 protein n=1 Tax=Flavobacterium macrobrachii TaxID=591204 RepID=A0ABS2D0Y5_9FLAO|nr:glycosyltransferase family 39 protein [Flavobacterium macrobrachii]MBM6500835.1 glycosyltransferase family 39 protein [Flavobacterium macrobrachii]